MGSYAANQTCLSHISDGALLELLARKTFDYFWLETNPANGLIRDRSTMNSPCSIAAVGFGLTAIPVAIERGWLDWQSGYERVHRTLTTFAEGGVEGKRGFYYHFVDMHSGRRWGDCEISSVDTAFFLAGALFASQYFPGTSVAQLGRYLYEQADWQWMLGGDKTISMGWKPETGFLQDRWERFDESMLMYIMAIGSPTYPIPVSVWDNIERPVNRNYISLPDEPLFVYQFSHVWIDFRNKEDRYANYWNNSIEATKHNRMFSIWKRSASKTYDTDIWGLSASDGPRGYRAYGASEGNHDGTVAPYAAVASLPFVPDLSMAAIRAMLEKHGNRVWGRYGFVSAFNVDEDWYSDQHIGIDQGDALLMIENYRSGFIWKHFMKLDAVRRGMDKIGFKAKKAAYAITPAYASRFQNRHQRCG